MNTDGTGKSAPPRWRLATRQVVNHFSPAQSPVPAPLNPCSSVVEVNCSVSSEGKWTGWINLNKDGINKTSTRYLAV